MSERRPTAVDPLDRNLEALDRTVRRMRKSMAMGSKPHVGTTTIDFGAAGTQEASVSVIGEASIAADSVARAWIFGSTSDNDTEAHLLASSIISLVIEDIVAGTGFTIRGFNRDESMTGTFGVAWEWI